MPASSGVIKGAITAELPIGSGEIESAHRYVIQQRLKRSGSWWRVENAWAMLAVLIGKQRGLPLVVLYLVVGEWRVPWSFRVWRGKGFASPAQLARSWPPYPSPWSTVE